MTDQREYTVLLIDDDACFREIVHSILSSLELRVVEAASGKQAEHIIETETPDLLIVDGELPDMSGVDWISELRRNDRHKDTPVIFAASRWPDLTSYNRLTDELK